MPDRVAPQPHLCRKCNTDHDGWEPGTFGAEIRCIKAQALAVGADALLARIEADEARWAEHRDQVLRDHFAGTGDPSLAAGETPREDQ